MYSNYKHEKTGNTINKNSLEIYIPCYDILNEEIYFFNFFNETVISKNNVDLDSQDDPYSDIYNINHDYKVSNNFKNNIDKDNANLNDSLGSNDFRNKLTLEDRNKLNKFLEKFKKNWTKMQLLTKFNSINSLPGEYKNYFKRPFYSRFFLNENLRLYSFNSCIGIPQVLTSYRMNVKIEFDQETILSLIKSKIEPFMDQISLTTIIDSIIKRAIDDLYNKISDDEKEIIKKHLEIKKAAFILKFKQNEEYLYGDSLIGSYQFVRGLLRQQELICFYLKIIPLYIISPSLMSFPPLIGIYLPHNKPIKNLYLPLLVKYLRNYSPNNGIIYRIFRPQEKNKKRFLKQNLGRFESLSRFCESCDCFYPLKINIKMCNNLFALKYWFDDEDYNKNEMLIPNLNFFSYKNLDKNNSNFGKKGFFCFAKRDVDPIKAAQEKQKNIENKERFKALSVMARKHEEDNLLQRDLNRLWIENNSYKFFEYGSNSAIGLNNVYSPDVYRLVSFLAGNDKNINDSYKVKSDFSMNIDKNVDIYCNENSILQKFKIFSLDNYVLPFCPSFVRIKVNLLYGSYSILSLKTEPFLFQNDIILNDKIIFDHSRCLISNLPFESRIALTIEAYDKTIKKNFILGSCQIPLYRSDGQLQNGIFSFRIWPNISVFPRFNNCSSFNFKKKVKKQKSLTNEKSYPPYAKTYLNETVEKLESCFDKLITIYEQDKEQEEKEKNIRTLINNYEQMHKEKLDNQKGGLILDDEKKGGDNFNKKSEENSNNIFENNANSEKDYQEEEEDEYCSITVEFPYFSSPLIYSQNSSQSYRDFLGIKYKDISRPNEKSKDDFEEMRKLYGNSQKDIDDIIFNFEKSNWKPVSYDKGRNYSVDLDKKESGFRREKFGQGKDIYPRHIWEYIKETLPLLVRILKKDPFEKLSESEITSILICRDYIVTIPSALELFLRAVDWINPLQVSIAHTYIKKWAKLEVEDAISLLDARFPDTETREFAISMLRDLPDELINLYMLQLCQCLMYETFLINPLSDLLIERSLINPKLIGNSFFWNSRVSMKNPLFADKLTVYLLQILMCSGENYLQTCFNGLYFNDYLEFMTYYVKIHNTKHEKYPPEYVAGKFNEFFSKTLNMKNFTFPIDPTYFGSSFLDNFKVFGSKMLPILLKFKSREGDTKTVIFKIGDDLRQDVLTLQIFNIMDKLWLDNNLDLKLIPYKVCPTELRAGFIECMDAKELDKLQQEKGFAGALDRELIVQYLRINSSNNDERVIKFDNFIKSLAGYCVATCVIGVGDRHPGNIMIKSNGIFCHIDFGHILGNFKSKFHIKRERSPFLLTPEMANVYITENKEEYFKTACVKAFNILRHNAKRLINIFIIMSTAGMPELCSMKDVEHVKKSLALDVPSDEDAGNHFIGLIKKSKNDRFRLIDNIFHNWKHMDNKKKKVEKPKV